MATLLLYFAASMIHLKTRDQTFTKMAKHIYCSAGGYREECNKYKAFLLAPSVVTTIAVMLFFLINLCHLLYVIHFQTVKETIKKLFPCKTLCINHFCCANSTMIIIIYLTHYCMKNKSVLNFSSKWLAYVIWDDKNHACVFEFHTVAQVSIIRN